MDSDWRRFCRRREFAVSGKEILVNLHDGRRHRVLVEDMDEAYRLTAIVVRSGSVSGVDDFPLRTWERNRETELVGFRIDARGRLVGESWVPKAGLSASEFQLYVYAVAAECDRYEYELTGNDA